MKTQSITTIFRFCKRHLLIPVLALVSGCVAYVPAHRAQVVYATPPVYAYQPQPAPLPPGIGPGPGPSVATSPSNVSEPNQPAPPPQQPVQVAASQPPAAVVAQAPPPPQAEVAPIAPGPDYVWTPGYWSWGGAAGFGWAAVGSFDHTLAPYGWAGTGQGMAGNGFGSADIGAKTDNWVQRLFPNQRRPFQIGGLSKTLKTGGPPRPQAASVV